MSLRMSLPSTIQTYLRALRFLLFEIGVAISEQELAYHYSYAKRQYLIYQGKLSTPGHPHALALFILKNAYFERWSTKLEQMPSPTFWLYLQQLPVKEKYIILEQHRALHTYDYTLTSEEVATFSLREILQYVPCFQTPVPIYWYAIATTDLLLAGNYQLNHLKNYFPKAMAQWLQSSAHYPTSSDHYLPIPVHAKHYQTLQLNKNLPFCSNRKISSLGMYAKQSMQTTGTWHLLQSPCDSHCYLNVRLLTEIDKPSNQRDYLTTKLSEILTIEEHFNHTLFALMPLACAQTLPHHPLPLFAEVQASAYQFCEQDEIAVTLTSLCNRSPITRKPLIVEIIEQSQLHPENFLRHYSLQLLASHLKLYLRYGMVIAASKTNTWVAFKKSLPVHFIYRDLTIYDEDHEHHRRLSHSQFSCAHTMKKNQTLLINKLLEMHLSSHLIALTQTISPYYPCLTKERLNQMISAAFDELIKCTRRMDNGGSARKKMLNQQIHAYQKKIQYTSKTGDLVVFQSYRLKQNTA